ncbi:MAG: hypothetical protein KY476_14785 [Planctomycetes bacterium]|nr:hypothetical protein [Planctomycetota bacterium]
MCGRGSILSLRGRSTGEQAMAGEPLFRMLRRAALACLCGALLLAAGCGDDEPQDEGGKAPGSIPVAANRAVESTGGGEAKPVRQLQEVTAALDDAIRLLDQKRYREFLEYYAPVETLRELRRTRDFDLAAQDLGAPGVAAELLTTLRKARAVTPVHDELLAHASFTVELTADERAGPSGDDPPAAPTGIVLDGYPGDLPDVLDAAIATLENGEYRTFVLQFYPHDVVKRLIHHDKLDSLTSRFAERPEMAESMIADLRALKDIQPKLDKNAALATYALPGGKEPIRLQKTAGTWRLYDEATAVYREISRLESLKPPATTVTIVFERLGDRWRLLQVP